MENKHATKKPMETLFRSSLCIAGVINILPAILIVLPEKISKSYGIEVTNVNVELLLRHRAVLFGIIGGLLFYAAISKKHYMISITVGLISMMSFIILYFLIGGINEELAFVMKIDLAGVLILLMGLLLFKL